MEQKEKVQELAETLKSRGLAASMVDAIDKAKSIILGITPKKESKESPSKIEESKEITGTSIDETNVTEKDVSEDIKEVERETDNLETKNDQEQQKLGAINKDNHDYDISKEEKPLKEIMEEETNKETEEDVFISSHESDNLLKETETTKIPPPEKEPSFITTQDEKPPTSKEEPISIEDIPEAESLEEKETIENPNTSQDNPKPTLTEEEKKKADLTEIFNFNKK